MLICCVLCLAGIGTTAAAESRSLTFYNTHTKEKATITYKVNGEFIPEGMKQVNHMMRDWRRDEPTKMDPELIDLIWEIYQELGSKEPIHLISGYRSKVTNEKLRRRGGGQARNSQHILGKAADIHFPDVSARKLRNSALVRELGGVGYYPKSALPFVHVDTGKVRHWPRMPRMELAALFPSGKTQHVPSDRRPITLADSRRALAKYPQYAYNRPKPKPAAPAPVVLASAKDTIADLIRRESASNASQPVNVALPLRKTKPRKPAVVTASLGTSSLALPWLTGASEAVGSIPKETPVSKPLSLELPSANADSEQGGEQPPVEEAAVAIVDEFDPEHPEELNYSPFPVAPLISDTPVSQDTRIAAFVEPDYQNHSYLLYEPERRIALPLRTGKSRQRVASSWEFTGSAVRNLLAPPAARPTHRQSQEILTAANPGTSGFGGTSGLTMGSSAPATGLGFAY